MYCVKWGKIALTGNAEDVCYLSLQQVMQIVRDLAGYTMGRSDLVRRAMSKKKSSVMEQERKNFVYGNEEEGVKGCINNGVDEKTANLIFDEMIDFAKYAFNKSHAVCYAVVSYQTAYLKYYYPLEFMAALMTSVMDNVNKISEYILSCRQMGISILPPDINEGESSFSVSGNAIRYGLSAIKSVGRPVVEEIIRIRSEYGKFVSMEDFISRLSGKEVNKRTLENFIKSGALDTLPGTRKQKVLVAPEMIDQKNKEKKSSLEGQLSFFDIVGEEEKKAFQVSFPDVGEFPKEELLAFEKEILGVYISGHPLEDYEEVLRKNITAVSADFVVDGETETAKVEDGAFVTLGGMVTGKTVKTTKHNQLMAFITLEDLVGSVEVVVFPKDFESQRENFTTDAKLFIRGRVSIGNEPVGKLICERVIPFDKLPREVWVKFKNKEDYSLKEQQFMDYLKHSEGNDTVVVYLEAERAVKRLPANWNVCGNQQLLSDLAGLVSEKNIKLVEKTIEKIGKMN